VPTETAACCGNTAPSGRPVPIPVNQVSSCC
jgi:hypothetical protein